ncbi:unnamed protein product [Prorocentrum cordatum]|uniref:Rad60/SUMO-like domain-containing protein n=1 Tax=Prorocentrum cordatum TaxID=2364126 RepID=A0ABN9X7F2_9DINO|nr:unnamed protein product [Polarella glacialis]
MVRTPSREKLQVRVLAQGEDGDRVTTIKMRLSMPFEKMMSAWCSQHGVERSEALFQRSDGTSHPWSPRPPARRTTAVVGGAVVGAGCVGCDRGTSVRPSDSPLDLGLRAADGPLVLTAVPAAPADGAPPPPAASAGPAAGRRAAAGRVSARGSSPPGVHVMENT